MTMERSYINPHEGFACCRWEAPSRESLAELFNKAGALFDSMIQVTEYSAG
ncbi:MAG: DUF4242 domain-containing protein [Candidatus Fermentibacteria bacterium]|nr:DUF4242 domain-containing protein [Candidatus Fermentibacteria bacterium]